MKISNLHGSPLALNGIPSERAADNFGRGLIDIHTSSPVIGVMELITTVPGSDGEPIQKSAIVYATSRNDVQAIFANTAEISAENLRQDGTKPVPRDLV